MNFLIKNTTENRRLGRAAKSLLLLWACIWGSGFNNYCNAQTNGPLSLSSANTTGNYSSNVSVTLAVGFSSSGPFSATIQRIDCIPFTTSATQGQNFVMTTVPRISGFTGAAQLSGQGTCQIMQTVQYFDGLGRPSQTVQVKGSPFGNDLVQPIAYDQFGREAIKYLPYALAGTAVNDGSYKTNALTAGAGQSAFYASPPIGVTAIPTPQATAALELSPLNRVIEQGAPGNPWQLSTSGISGSGNTVKMIYATNDGTTYWAKRYAVNIDGSGNRTLLYLAAYSPNQLDVTVSKNENWTGLIDSRLNTTETYTDKLGHVVLKRNYNYTSAVQVLSTYYVYDDLGNLAYVLPPGANPDAGLTSASNQTTLNNFCYQYNYDNRNRVITRQLPGKGVEELVYNLLDQAILTRDANQLSRQEWAFTKFDALGRVIMTGVDKASTSTRAALQSYVTNCLTAGTFQQWELPTTGSGVQGYTNNCFPNDANVVPLTVNYYDNYSFPGNPYVASASGVSTNVLGLLTGIKTAVLNTDGTYGAMLYTVNYYDALGRSIETLKEHYLGGTTGAANASNYDDIVNTYDFTNELTGTVRHHYTTASTTAAAVIIGNSYYYDHMGRKTQTWEAITVGTNTPATAILLSQNDYNEVGQLMTKHLHSTNSGASFLQNTNYAYNERGWLLKVNDPTVAPTTTQLFAEQLNYNATQYGTTAQFNGNIAEVVYNAGISGQQHATYTYDPLNRLTSGTSSAGFSETGISYDQMGNILALTRAGTGNGTLAYTYTNGNQLASISGFKAGSYVYDANGNMTSDGPRAAAIGYNMLNLPRTVTATGVNLSYSYAADGNKLRKISGATTADYIGGIQYANGAIAFIQTEEGRAINTGGANYNYEYTLTDHLGNNRVTFDMLNGKVGENDYYPFGLNIARQQNSVNNYLYNKKELQVELNEYDYGARFYDPVIARWATIDRFAEKYKAHSSYVYTLDNPIKTIDINGDSSVVLNAPHGAHGEGHMAQLIQGTDGKYHLYSKNGTNESSGLSGPNNQKNVKGVPGNDVGTGSYKTPKDFMNSASNPVINKKTGEREYSEGYVIPATKEQDKLNIEGEKAILKQPYDVITSSCGTAVQAGLNKEGKDDGSPSFLDTLITRATGLGVELENTYSPNKIYERIKENNKGTVITP